MLKLVLPLAREGDRSLRPVMDEKIFNTVGVQQISEHTHNQAQETDVRSMIDTDRIGLASSEVYGGIFVAPQTSEGVALFVADIATVCIYIEMSSSFPRYSLLLNRLDLNLNFAGARLSRAG
jgi:hypothetical protein